MLLETLLTAILRARKWDPLSFFPSRTSWRCHQPVERAIIPYCKSLKFQRGARGELGPRSPAGPELGSRPLPPLLPSPRGRCGPSAAQARRLPSEKAGGGRCTCILHARRALARGRHCGQVCGPDASSLAGPLPPGQVGSSAPRPRAPADPARPRMVKNRGGREKARVRFTLAGSTLPLVAFLPPRVQLPLLLTLLQRPPDSPRSSASVSPRSTVTELRRIA